MVELYECSSVLWEIGLGKESYSAEEICKQRVEGVAWFLLPAYYVMQGKRNELKKKLLSKKRHRIERFEKISKVAI